ncbi:MAG: DivIVA domain-containing protein [Clostridia bacterium]|nr:DivIVA domain-containing protein [Clostridia bacterium]
MKRRKNQHTTFTVTKKGYSMQEVDAYVDQCKKIEQAQLDQRERIVALVSEVNSLKEELLAYKAKEGQIAEAIISATDRADKIKGEMRLRYAMELDRLDNFRKKWTGVYNELKARYGFDSDALNAESVAVSTRIEIEKVLSRDFSLSIGQAENEAERAFKQEAERLSAGSNELKNKLLEAMKRSKTVACSFDE